MKVALVHDWLTGMRGGELCLEALCRLFPDAPIFTLLHIEGTVSDTIASHEIRTSWLQKMPTVRTKYRNYLPLFPAAIESLDFRGFDLIVSVSHCVAKGIIPPPDAVHLSYLLSPMRYVWDMRHDYFGEGKAGKLVRGAATLVSPWLRSWDSASAHRVDNFASISRHVADRAHRYYGRASEVLHPPVECARFTPGSGPGDYYLCVSAMVPYKRVDLAVRACTELGLPLKVIGKGPEEANLRAVAGPTVEFLGWLPNTEIAEHYRNCRAFLFPGEEDFGITPLEAQASGRPVIAYGRGGILDTTVAQPDWDGRATLYDGAPTGYLFGEQSLEGLVEAIRSVESGRVTFDPSALRAHAAQFDLPVFERKLREFTERGAQLLAERRGRRG